MRINNGVTRMNDIDRNIASVAFCILFGIAVYMLAIDFYYW